MSVPRVLPTITLAEPYTMIIEYRGHIEDVHIDLAEHIYKYAIGKRPWSTMVEAKCVVRLYSNGSVGK